MSKKIEEMVCITCPLGCRMEIEVEDGKLQAVRHNSCKRGLEYARQEFYDPRRMVTATALVSGGILSRVSVRTSGPIPFASIPDLLHAIYALTLSAPLEMGTIIIENFANTGVNVSTTRHIRKAP